MEQPDNHTTMCGHCGEQVIERVIRAHWLRCPGWQGLWQSLVARRAKGPTA